MWTGSSRGSQTTRSQHAVSGSGSGRSPAGLSGQSPVDPGRDDRSQRRPGRGSEPVMGPAMVGASWDGSATSSRGFRWAALRADRSTSPSLPARAAGSAPGARWAAMGGRGEAAPVRPSVAPAASSRRLGTGRVGQGGCQASSCSILAGPRPYGRSGSGRTWEAPYRDLAKRLMRHVAACERRRQLPQGDKDLWPDIFCPAPRL
jgi:hypothetical protein